MDHQTLHPVDLRPAQSLVRLSCLPWVLAATWLVFAAWDNAGKDGGCFAGQPVWAFSQATVALIGVALTFAASSSDRRWSPPTTGARRRWFVVSAVLLGVWVLVVWGLQPDVKSLPYVSCGS